MATGDVDHNRGTEQMNQAVHDDDTAGNEGDDGPRRALNPLLLIVGIGAALAVVASLSVLVGGSGSNPDADGATDITEFAFVDEDGSSATLADFEGQPLVVNFFASWCGPCRAEMPDLEQVHVAAGDQVSFLGVNHDIDETSWRSFVDESEVTFPTVFQPNQEIYEALGLFGMPSTILIDADGRIVHSVTGVVTTESLTALIAEHLSVEL